jgi:predicted HD phosphohydrolase
MTSETLSRASILPFLEDIMRRRGAESYLGEDVTMAEHMLQAAFFAEQQRAPPELVAAALLHDIGHFITEFGPYSPADTTDNHHDRAGAMVLVPFFPPLMTECIRLHVPAKRYLCAKNPVYMQKLSVASAHSLTLQGGAMTRRETIEFEDNVFHREAIQLRIWDDRGKVPGMMTKKFGDYKDLLHTVLVTDSG